MVIQRPLINGSSFLHLIFAMTSNNTKRLYIGNLEPSVDEYAVVKLFEPYGKITFLDYMFHWSGPKKGQPRGYCFLEYEKKENALNAMSALSGKVVKGRPLVVSFAHQSSEHDERRGHHSSATGNRPNSFTLLRAQRMSNASTDAKIQAIERKLAAYQNKESPPPPATTTTTTITDHSKIPSSTSHHHNHPSKSTQSTASSSSLPADTKKSYPVKSNAKKPSASPSSSNQASSSSSTRRFKPY
ncbi:hypothetical protein BDA99DRAFT_510658 [Phascolomyces articulosus]|uniref:Probable RNA-binding protein 18 n=1 Tax=Phascolomyces articulosus TaxID=60185 RepID=A0AAD5JZT4_9FUNG|nr:hypothetical protein BDA99DRAFT_510658 [Phascolomyces articulosus]